MWFTISLIVTLLVSQAAADHPTTKVCPILGPSFPKPTNLNSLQPFQQAAKSLESQIDTALRGGTDAFGRGLFNQTTFSVGVFNIEDNGLLYQRHYTSASVTNSSLGTHNVDENTVYRIGSISKLMTMYTLLIVDGDKSWNFPVTNYLPQLAKIPEPDFSSTGVLPQWDQIAVIDLATHQGGIVSDCRPSLGMTCVSIDSYWQMAPTILNSTERTKAFRHYRQIACRHVAPLVVTNRVCSAIARVLYSSLIFGRGVEWPRIHPCHLCPRRHAQLQQRRLRHHRIRPGEHHGGATRTDLQRQSGQTARVDTSFLLDSK